ncbi:MAG: hypothetical protein ACOWWM_20660 [Desulfobacterales bacterium]
MHEHHGSGGSSDAGGRGTPELPIEEKFIRLASHWIGHNEDHAASYRKWADTIAAAGLPEAAALLNEAAEMTRAVSRRFEEAVEVVKRSASA